jgi:hypothetical protein
MEFIKKAVRVGNSAGVLLPKSFLGAEVKIQVIKRKVDIKKEIIKLVYPMLEQVECIFMTNENPFEAIAISDEVKKILKKSGLKLSFVSFNQIKQDMKTNLLLKEKILNAKPILNNKILEELKKEARKKELVK